MTVVFRQLSLTLTTSSPWFGPCTISLDAATDTWHHMFRFAAFLRQQIKKNKEVQVWSSRYYEDSANISNFLDILKKEGEKILVHCLIYGGRTFIACVS